MEAITLASPEVTPQITTTEYRVTYLLLNWGESFIAIQLRGTNGERKEARYEGAAATTLMVGLNKANLAIKSLHRRILEQLIADGKLVGSVNGSPD